MSRSSQKNYLSQLLETPSATEEIEQDRASRSSTTLGSSLLSRANSLERIASGELKQVTQIRIDPKRCRIWSGNARDYGSLNYDRCRDLIDSMIGEGGQKVPALVRKLKNDCDHDYEVIYGTRRHWATCWLRANNYPDVLFIAEVRELDDEAAFRLCDLENRARADITEIERARNYAAALPRHYEGKQARMAERLNISKGLLSKMIAFASINDKIMAAFAAPGELSLRQGYTLAQATSSAPSRARAARVATAIARENDIAREGGMGGGPPTAVALTRLLQAATGETSSRRDRRQALFDGRPVVTVLDDNRKGLRLQVHAEAGADLQVILDCLKEMVEGSRLMVSSEVSRNVPIEAPAPAKFHA